MGRPPSPVRDKFIIRLPDGMKDQIKDAAEGNDRTMTAEIVARLRMTFDMGLDVPEPLSERDQVKALRSEFEDLREEVKALRYLVNVVMEVEGKP